jgi:hypothetical protein
VNDISISITTGTRWPRRVPGSNTHFLTVRSNDADLPDGAVLEDHGFEKNDALNLGAHRVGGVVRLDLANEARRCHAVARTIGAAAKPAAVSWPEARSVAGAASRSTPRACATVRTRPH